MQKRLIRNIFKDSRGFSLLEVLMGVTVFMIGMLGVTALNISSLKSNTFSGNMSEAIHQASDKLEELMVMEYDELIFIDDGDGQGENEDQNDDGIDEQTGNGENFGLDDFTEATADDFEPPLGRNDMYRVFWNVAVDEPVPNTTTVNVIVRWQVKDVWRQINMSTIRVREL